MDITDYLAVGILASQAVVGVGIAYGITVVRRRIAKLQQSANAIAERLSYRAIIGTANSPIAASRIDEPHHHRFDTMVGDGAGWRCGSCGAPKEGL